MKKSTKKQLPSLVFGSLRSTIDHDLIQMQERVSSITNWVSDFDALPSDIGFRHVTTTYAEDQFCMLAVSSSPTVMRVYDPNYTIAIPISGSLKSQVDKFSFTLASPHQALFFPPGRRFTEGHIKSVLLLSVSERRLLTTAHRMLEEKRLASLDLHRPRLLETRHGVIDFLEMIRHVTRFIDQLHGNQELLKHFSPGENIIRIMVMMMFPECVLHQLAAEPAIVKPRDSRIVELCEYLEDHLDRPFNLSDLEAMSGISARVLQQEFRKRTGQSPLQWLRDQRLDKARQLLSCPSGETRISQVALVCGFDNFSDFANRYRQRFGELPSETLRRATS
ncbi:helix-turn-helix domain-containing protein [Thauera sp.]|uniref:AraC family transcriptional regulator n=1 Tax=Thauera sp. TaxID=1905334 RepID=UPI0039E2A209